MNRSWKEQKIKLNMKKYRQDHDKAEKSWSFLMKSKGMKLEDVYAKRNAEYQRKPDR